MSEADALLVDATTRIFQDLCDPQTVNAATDAAWKAPLWQALEESGLTLAWVAEERGGAGASLADGFAIAGVSGRFAVPMPLGENLLAGWLLGVAGLDSPAGAMTVAPSRPRDRLTLTSKGTLQGRALGIPFAGSVETIVALASQDGANHVVHIAAKDCVIQGAPGLSGDGRDAVTFDGVVPLAIASLPDGLGGNCLTLMGAAVRAAQIGGALQEILTMASEYAQERVAFEKPIAKFQAVQHNLARLAGETAAAVAAASSAADTIHTIQGLGDAAFFEVAAAKIRAGEAAGEGAAIAHQVYGAIGFTEEHILHRFTQRLWAWRDDFGNESEWAVQLGEFVADGGADELWPLLASR
jgi:alkylation response protein AidB-like acyl-CoA dehydrogenase